METRNSLVLPATGNRNVLAISHVGHNALTPMNSNVLVIDGVAFVEWTISNWCHKIPPRFIRKYGFGPVVIPLVLRTELPNASRFGLVRRRQKPFDLFPRFAFVP